MEYDPMEGTSESFKPRLSDEMMKNSERWESFTEQLDLVEMTDDIDADDFFPNTDTDDEEFITRVEGVKQEDASMSKEWGDETCDTGTSWVCDGTVQKLINGEITFSELDDIVESRQVEHKPPPPKKQKTDTEKKPREETHLEREDREYKEELKKKLKRAPKKRNQLPNELTFLLGAANLNYAEQKIEIAIKMCMELIRLVPNAYEPYQALGLFYEDIDSRKSFIYYLLAAYLNPSETRQWVRLAQLSIEQNEICQAIKCYSHAINNDPTNVTLLWKRCRLCEKAGHIKRALAGYELIMNQLANSESVENGIEEFRELARACYAYNDSIKAISVLETAFKKYPLLIASEDVYWLIEIKLEQKFYKDVLMICVRHCGVTLQMPNRIISSSEVIDGDEDFTNLNYCCIPDYIPLDLSAKILICLIHLKAMKAVEPLLDSLKKENVSEFGDLYLDVAKVFMEVGEYQYAEELLGMLVCTSNYDQPDVWMKYGECLLAVQNIEEAVIAYKNVIIMEPSCSDAKLVLSNIYRSQGKTEEAISTLQQEYDKGKEISLSVLYRRCQLLESGRKWENFITCATRLQYSHCFELETEQEIKLVVERQTEKYRNKVLKALKAKARVPMYIGGSVPEEEMWEIFNKVSDKLLKLKRYDDLMKLSVASLTSTMFMKNPEMAGKLEIQALLSCYFNKSYKHAHILAKYLIRNNMGNSAAWNVFALIATLGSIRPYRFCLRLMINHPDHIALGYFIAHNSMLNSKYVEALAMYMWILKQRPDDPFVNFCIGITFTHMAYRTPGGPKHHFHIIQGYAFLMKYLKLKGECQETYYNIGRALHLLGFKDMALHYYKKALDSPLLIFGEDEEVFDLRREIAYSIFLIYEESKAMDLAYMYLRKYITI